LLGQTLYTKKGLGKSTCHENIKSLTPLATNFTKIHQMQHCCCCEEKKKKINNTRFHITENIEKAKMYITL